METNRQKAINFLTSDEWLNAESYEDETQALTKLLESKQIGGQVECLGCQSPMDFQTGTCPNCGRKEF